MSGAVAQCKGLQFNPQCCKYIHTYVPLSKSTLLYPWLFRKLVSDNKGHKSSSSTVAQPSASPAPCSCEEDLIQEAPKLRLR